MIMEENIYLDKLGQRDIKPTAMRLLILRAMMQFNRAFSLLDLETYLDTVDKSTLSRTINLFLKHHLIHGIDDGSGSLSMPYVGMNATVTLMICTYISIVLSATRHIACGIYISRQSACHNISLRKVSIT